MRIKFLSTILLLLMLVLQTVVTGCKKKEQQAPAERPAPVVEAMTITSKNIPIDNMYVGIVEGSKSVEVRAQVGGILNKRHYQEGSYVNAGDVLFTIDSGSYQAALKVSQGNLDLAKAQLQQAKQNYDRMDNLYKTNSVSKKDYDAAYAAYKSALAQVESAQGSLNDSRIKLGYTQVIAPVSGYTSKANFTEGNLIAAGEQEPLTIINKVDPINVNFSVPATVMTELQLLEAEGRIKVSKQLYSTIFLDNGNKYSERGTVIFLDKMITASTGAIQIKAEFPNTNLALLPGQYVRVSLDGYVLVNAISIPQKAVIQRNGMFFVIVVGENNIAEYRPIKIGMNLGNSFYVYSGLKDGERIVIEGTNKVAPGSPVNIVVPKAQQNAAAQQQAGAKVQQ